MTYTGKTPPQSAHGTPLLMLAIHFLATTIVARRRAVRAALPRAA
jgi:hypothetical protein